MEQEEKEKIKIASEEREVNPCQAFFALFISAAAENGILRQGMINLISERISERLFEYLKIKGFIEIDKKTEKEEKFCELLKQVNEALGIGKVFETEINRSEGKTIVKIKFGGKFCRYCPKGVGLAEIPGSLCPFPILFKKMGSLIGIKVSIIQENGFLKKEEGLCIVKYEIL